jgi:hypothetical protein
MLKEYQWYALLCERLAYASVACLIVGLVFGIWLPLTLSLALLLFVFACGVIRRQQSDRALWDEAGRVVREFWDIWNEVHQEAFELRIDPIRGPSDIIGIMIQNAARRRQIDPEMLRLHWQSLLDSDPLLGAGRLQHLRWKSPLPVEEVIRELNRVESLSPCARLASSYYLRTRGIAP